MREEHCPSRAAAPFGVTNEAVFSPCPIPLSTPCYKNLQLAAPFSPQLLAAAANFLPPRHVQCSILGHPAGPCSAACPLTTRQTVGPPSTRLFWTVKDVLGGKGGLPTLTLLCGGRKIGGPGVERGTRGSLARSHALP